MGWIVMSLRALRQAGATAIGLALLVLVTAFVFAVAPGLLTRVADDALRTEVGAADARERNLQLTQERRVGADARGVLAGIEELGRRFEEQLPAGLVELIEGRSLLLDTPRWSVRSATTAAANLTFRWQPDARSRIEYEAGRPPSGELTTASWPATDEEPERTVVAIEGALSTTTAERLGVEVGDTLLLELDTSDRLAAGHRALRVALLVSGTFAVVEPTATFWLDDRRLEIPGIRALSSEIQFIDAFALVPDEAYRPFIALTDQDQLPLRYAWRWYVDTERLTAARADALVRDLRRLESVFRPDSGTSAGLQPPTLQSGLLRLVDDQRIRWHSVEVILAVVLLGPAVVAAAAVALAGALAARRRRSALETWRGRGASTLQLVGALTIDGLVAALPAALVATLLVVTLVPEGSTRQAALIAAMVAVVAVVLLVAAASPARVGPPGSARREASVGRPASPRRLVFETLVVGLALAGAYLLRERGLAGTSSAGELTGADPLIAAVPALVGVAAGIVAIRLAPLPLALLAGLTATRRDLVPVLGLRRATRGGAGGAVLLVLLATATLAVFSAATLVQIGRSAETVGWLETGAPFRVTAPNALPVDLDLSAVPEVTAQARAYEATGQEPTRGVAARLLVVEAREYQRVIRDTAIDAELPVDLMGGPGGPVAAIVSTAVATDIGALAGGDTIPFVFGATAAELVVADIRDTFPALPGVDRFVILPLEPLVTAYPTADMPPTILFVRAPDAVADDLRAAVEAVAPQATVLSRDERSREILASPVVAALVAGAVGAAVVTAVYAALAVAAALVLAGAARAIETAHLRTLGLSRRGAVGLLVVELGPVVAVAFVLGGLLGLGLFVLLQPGLGLGAIVGSPSDLPLVIEPAALLLVLVAVLVIVAVGLLLAATLQSRAVPALAIRGGIES